MRALIFDCDGVLADTERDGHRPAFNQAFEELGLPLRWTPEEYGDKLAIGGGKERLRAALSLELLAAAGLPSDEESRHALITRLHARKTEIYAALVAAGGLPGRPGVVRLVEAALAAGWKLAVASTSAPASVRAVLDHVVGTGRAGRFDAIVAGDDVAAKKPSPDVYLRALERLQVQPSDAVAIEDSRIGLQAATAAGIRTVVTPSDYTTQEAFHEAALVVTSLGDPGEPARVLQGPSLQGDVVALADLERILVVTSGAPA